MKKYFVLDVKLSIRMNSIKMYFVVLLSMSFLLQNCQGSDLEKMKTVNQEKLPDEVSKEMKLIYSDSGRVKRIIEAPLIHKYTTDTNYMEFPEGLFAQFFNNNGEVVTELKCGYALTTGKEEELIFRKNVVFKNKKNETLLSEEVYLKDSVIYSDSTVYIITPSISLRGSSLEAPRDFSSYKLNNPVGVARTEALNTIRED